ncbi:hypothetical protein [Fibrivirga algicola]|nr:hypothetical protein [Fibrivirga algicola]
MTKPRSLRFREAILCTVIVLVAVGSFALTIITLFSRIYHASH